MTKPAIFIDVEGDEWEETIDRSETLVKECTLSSKEIVDKIAASGIVGLGGATFPTQVKLMPPPGNKAEIVIINAVECEPYLTSDHFVDAGERRANPSRCHDPNESGQREQGRDRYRE